MSKEAFREAIQKLTGRPDSSRSSLYDQIEAMLPALTPEDKRAVFKEKTADAHDVYNFSVVYSVLPIRILRLLTSKGGDGFSYEAYESCLKANVKLTSDERAELLLERLSESKDQSSPEKEIPDSKETHFQSPSVFDNHTFSDDGLMQVKQGLVAASEANKKNLIEDAEVKFLAEFLLQSKTEEDNVAWVLKKFSSDLVMLFLTRAQDLYDKRHTALAQQRKSGWEEILAERHGATRVQVERLLPPNKSQNSHVEKLQSLLQQRQPRNNPGKKANDVPAPKFTVARYLTSGQFWVGLLFALGLVLLCMPFAAPVVFPVLGLAAFVSSAAGTVALEASIAAVCGFGIFQLLWKFGDYFDLAQKLQKLGQWMEKGIKRLVYLLTAGVSTLVNGLLGLGQFGGIFLVMIGNDLLENVPFLLGWLGLAMMAVGVVIFISCVVSIFAITILVGLGALAITGVGLVLETLGWIFAMPLKGISENPENLFLRNIKNWVFYLIAFPFFQLQKLGKFIAETAFTVFMSVYADLGGFGFLILNMAVAGAKEKAHAEETRQHSDEPYRVYPLPYLKEDVIFYLEPIRKGWKALEGSSSVHEVKPLVDMPQAAQESSQDPEWVSSQMMGLVQTYNENGVRAPMGAM